MSTAFCNTVNQPFGIGAIDAVQQQFNQFANLANQFVTNANQWDSVLKGFNVTPVSTGGEYNFDAIKFTAFAAPGSIAPLSRPKRTGGDPPPRVTLNPVDPNFSMTFMVTPPGDIVVDVPVKETLDKPTAPDKVTLTTLTKPTLDTPTKPTLDTSIALTATPYVPDPVVLPTYVGEPLPPIPTMIDLNLPDAPEIDWSVFEFDYEAYRPDVDGALDLYENTYLQTVEDVNAAMQSAFDTKNTVGTAVRGTVLTWLDGGTGLPPAIEQALFDRAYDKENVSSLQAIAQAQQEWGARGFTLPGSTLLAREQEIRQTNRNERGRLNREITIQVHEQEIENLRFTMQQGVALEGQLLDQFIRIRDLGRQIADGAFAVARDLLNAQVEILRAKVSLYQADIATFKERVQVELAKLEVFRAQMDGERARGEVNEMRVRMYEAQVRGVLAGVEVFRGQVEGANAKIRAQTSLIEQFRAQVDAYVARLQGERVKFEVFDVEVRAEEAKTRLFDAEVRGEEAKVRNYSAQVEAYSAESQVERLKLETYDAEVRAEEAKVRMFQAQVQAFAERVSAYRAQVDAEAARVGALTGYNESKVRQFSAEVDSWAKQADYDIASLNAEVGVLQANTQRYVGELSAEQARVQGEARNAEIQFQQNQAQVAAAIKAVDQAIAQLQLVSTLGLEAYRTAAQTNAQLAASAMAGISVSAKISETSSRGVSRQASCSHNYNYSVSE